MTVHEEEKEVKQEVKQENGGNWLIDYFSVIASLAAFVLFYLVVAGFNHSMNPLDWAPTNLMVGIVLSLLMLVVVLNYQQSQGYLNFDALIKSLVDLEQYKNLKPIDAFLSHYGNLATIGLILGLLIYSARTLEQPLEPKIMALVAGVLLFFLFFLYSLQFAKIAFRIAENRWISAVFVIGIFFIDAQAIKLIIAGIPK